MKNFKKYSKPAILLLFLIALVLLWTFTDISSLFTEENLQQLEQLITSLGVWAPLGFMLVYIIATVTFLPATPLSLAGGFVFGPYLGTLYVVVGAGIGACAAFLLARYLGKDFCDRILKNKLQALSKYNQKLEENGFLTMLFLRLIPLFPFNGLNFGLGITKITFRDYALGTFLGIIPGAFVIANIGASAGNPTGPRLYLFIALFFLLAALPKIYSKVKKKK